MIFQYQTRVAFCQSHNTLHRYSQWLLLNSRYQHHDKFQVSIITHFLYQKVVLTLRGTPANPRQLTTTTSYPFLNASLTVLIIQSFVASPVTPGITRASGLVDVSLFIFWSFLFWQINQSIAIVPPSYNSKISRSISNFRSRQVISSINPNAKACTLPVIPKVQG